MATYQPPTEILPKFNEFVFNQANSPEYLDQLVVHKAGTETITGDKTFKANSGTTAVRIQNKYDAITTYQSLLRLESLGSAGSIVGGYIGTDRGNFSALYLGRILPSGVVATPTLSIYAPDYTTAVGRVGIGTLTPAYNFEVIGTARISNSFTASRDFAIGMDASPVSLSYIYGQCSFTGVNSKLISDYYTNLNGSIIMGSIFGTTTLTITNLSSITASSTYIPVLSDLRLDAGTNGGSFYFNGVNNVLGTSTGYNQLRAFGTSITGSTGVYNQLYGLNQGWNWITSDNFNWIQASSNVPAGWIAFNKMTADTGYNLISTLAVVSTGLASRTNQIESERLNNIVSSYDGGGTQVLANQVSATGNYADNLIVNSGTNGRNRITASGTGGENIITSTIGTNTMTSGKATGNANLIEATGAGINTITSASGSLGANTITATSGTGVNLIRATAAGGANTIQTTTGTNTITSSSGLNTITTGRSGINISNILAANQIIATGNFARNEITASGSAGINQISSNTNVITTTNQNQINSSGTAANANLITASGVAGGNTIRTTNGGDNTMLVETGNGSNNLTITAGTGGNNLTAVANPGGYNGITGYNNYYDANIAHKIRIGVAPGTEKIVVNSTDTTITNTTTTLAGTNLNITSTAGIDINSLQLASISVDLHCAMGILNGVYIVMSNSWGGTFLAPSGFHFPFAVIVAGYSLTIDNAAAITGTSTTASITMRSRSGGTTIGISNVNFAVFAVNGATTQYASSQPNSVSRVAAGTLITTEITSLYNGTITANPKSFVAKVYYQQVP